MTPSTPPPPDTSNTAASSRPPLQNSPRPPPPNTRLFYSPPPSRLPSNPNPNYPQLAPRPPDPSHFLYPVASSGRGFLSRPLPITAAGPNPRPPLVFPYSQPGQGNPGFVRPIHLPHLLAGFGPGSAGTMPSVVKGLPVSSLNHSNTILPSNAIYGTNGQINLRDRNRDDTLTVVRDRKVRITENASLYTLCRSWLRDGFPEETQPQYRDAVKSLPRPLPVAVAQAVESPDKVAEDKEDEDEAKESLEQLSEKELLQRHIKHAKKVRSRLREERLQRISRYKTRLALLLPPTIEQQYKNESTEQTENDIN